ILHYDGKGGTLRTDKEFTLAEFQVDLSFPAKPKDKPSVCVLGLHSGAEGEMQLSLTPDGKIELTGPTLSGGRRSSANTTKDLRPAGQWNRLRLVIEENVLRVW